MLYHAMTACACHILNLSPPLQQQTDRKATCDSLSTQSCMNLNFSALILLESFACKVSPLFSFVLSFRTAVGQCKKRCEGFPQSAQNPLRNCKIYRVSKHSPIHPTKNKATARLATRGNSLIFHDAWFTKSWYLQCKNVIKMSNRSCFGAYYKKCVSCETFIDFQYP